MADLITRAKPLGQEAQAKPAQSLCQIYVTRSGKVLQLNTLLTSEKENVCNLLLANCFM